MFKSDLTVRRMIGSRDTWQLKDSLVWYDGGRVITVPRGFIFDFASVPRVLRNILPANGRNYDRAACLHDWLYTVQTVTRKEADALFLRAMQCDGVASVTAGLMYRAVRLFGGSAWRTVTTEERDKMREFAETEFAVAAVERQWKYGEAADGYF